MYKAETPEVVLHELIFRFFYYLYVVENLFFEFSAIMNNYMKGRSKS